MPAGHRTLLEEKLMADSEFFNLYRHGFIRAAACVPQLRVADPDYNAAKTIEMCRAAAENKALIAIFPEMGISGYSNEDLFHQDALLQGVLTAVNNVLSSTADLATMIVIGAPLQADSFLFNCGVVIYRGKILGIAVKSYLPNYREYYEARHFKPALEAISTTIDICGQKGIPFGANLLFEAENVPRLCSYFEICEDLWVPIPPSILCGHGGGHCDRESVGIEYNHSQSRNTGASLPQISPPAAFPRIFTLPPARANQPPTSRGTAMR